MQYTFGSSNISFAGGTITSKPDWFESYIPWKTIFIELSVADTNCQVLKVSGSKSTDFQAASDGVNITVRAN